MIDQKYVLPHLLDGKVALVTGGTSGIGATAARALAASGAAVVIAGRREAEGEQVAEEIRASGCQARFVRRDVTVEADVAHLVEAAVRAYGRLDIAFNNAGRRISAGKLETIRAEDFIEDITLNLTGVFYALKYEIPAMQKGGGGSIINNASTAGVHGVAYGLAPYAAAKHGVIGLTRSAALEQAANGIRINALVTGSVATEHMTAQAVAEASAWNPMKRIGRPEEIGALVVYLASDLSAYITGAALAIDGGQTAA